MAALRGTIIMCVHGAQSSVEEGNYWHNHEP